jgi:MFS family permease
MSSFYSAASPEQEDDPFYRMKLDVGFVDTFDKDSYSLYQVYYTIGMIPSLLLLGPITQKTNRKVVLGIATIVSSLAIMANAYTNAMW